MKDIELLNEGYARVLPDGTIYASPATVLIWSSGKKVLVDPGANVTLLFQSLTSRQLNPEDIDAVFLTHYHPDHFLNIRFFPKQDIYDGTMIYRNDKEIPYMSMLPGTEIRVLATPGHTPEHASLVVDTSSGKFAVSGDVFWWEDGRQPIIDIPSLVGLDDPFAQDILMLKESRKKLLHMADFIIPGHGKVFKVPQNGVNNGI